MIWNLRNNLKCWIIRLTNTVKLNQETDILYISREMNIRNKQDKLLKDIKIGNYTNMVIHSCRPVSIINGINRTYTKYVPLGSFASFGNPFSINPIDNMITKMLNVVNPKVIVLYYEYGGIEQRIIKLAKERNIKIIAIQHGITITNNDGYKTAPKYVPDYFICWGKYDLTNVQPLMNAGCKIKELGSPQHDKIKGHKYNRETLLKKYGLNELPIILWATQGHDKRLQKEHEELAKLLREMPNQVIVKLHPNETDKSIYKGFKVFGRSSDLFELIYIADLIIIKNSTVGIEATLFNKPVIISNLMDNIELKAVNMFPQFKDNTKLKEMINVSTKPINSLYYFTNQGCSIPKIKEFIKGVLDETKD